MSSEEKKQHLRVIRNALLNDTNTEVLKYLSMGQEVPKEIQDYLQSLRDLPANYDSDEDAVYPMYPKGDT
jgi:hypothetical protein